MVVDGVVVVVEGVMVAEDSTIEADLEAAVGEDLAKGVLIHKSCCLCACGVYCCTPTALDHILQPGFSVRMQHLPKVMGIQ